MILPDFPGKTDFLGGGSLFFERQGRENKLEVEIYILVVVSNICVGIWGPEKLSGNLGFEKKLPDNIFDLQMWAIRRENTGKM